MRSICVFCGSSKGNDNDFIKIASDLGMYLASKNIHLIYGGANVGLMGALANGCLNNGGIVTGVITEYIRNLGVAHEGLSELKVTQTMHERKFIMNEMSDGFIMLPGGIGTIEETFEVFTWVQLGIHLKPIGVLNINNFFDYMDSFLKNLIKMGFLREEHYSMLKIDNNIDSLIEKMSMNLPEKILKWKSIDENMIHQSQLSASVPQAK